MITGTLSGRLTADPQVHQGNNGNFTSFSVAVNHGKKNDVEQVTFVDCTSNGKTGELIAQRFKKGNVFSGPAVFSIREYESNGQKNKALSANVSMIDWQASQPTPQDQNAAAAPPQGYAQPPAGYQQPGYGAPPAPQYGQPPQQGFGTPSAPGYGAPPQNYGQPPQQQQPVGYGAQPPQAPAPQQYAQPPQQAQQYGAPPQQQQQMQFNQPVPQQYAQPAAPGAPQPGQYPPGQRFDANGHPTPF